MINKKQFLLFQNILLCTIGSSSYALEDTKLMRQNQYNSIPKMLNEIATLQSNSGNQNVINTLLGGSGTIQVRSTAVLKSILITPTNITSDVNTLARQILPSPTGNLQTDLRTARGQLVTTPGATLATDIGTVNTVLGGSGTTQVRSTGVLNKILITPTNLTSDVTTLNAQILASPTGNLQTDLTTARGNLVTTPGATLAADIGIVNTVLGGSGTTQVRSTGVLNKILTTPTNITSDVATLNAQILASPTGNLQTDLRTARGQLVTTPGATLAADIGTVNTVLGGSGTTQVRSNAILNDILASPTGVISSDLTTVRGKLVTTLGATTEADIGTINSLLNGTASGSTIQERIGAPIVNGSASDLATVIGGSGSNLANALGDPGSGSIISNIGGSTTSVQAALDALSTALVNNTTFSSSLTTQVGTLSNTLDNTLSSLPSSSTTATIAASATSDGSGGVNMGFSGLGSANGTYNLSSGTIVSNISNGGTFTFINGSNSLVLYNRSGSTISTQSQAIHYLASIYPSTSRISNNVSDKITNGVNRLVGGSGTSLRTRIAAVDATLLTNPTGVLTTDLATARSQLVTSGGATLEADINTLNSLLNGTASGSTTQERIGTPIVNGSASDLATVIGGPGSDLASKLGDPILGSGSNLSGLINASSANNNNGIYLSAAVDNLKNATNIYDQFQYFLALFDPNNFTNSADTNITFTIGGNISSLADIINSATLTS